MTEMYTNDGEVDGDRRHHRPLPRRRRRLARRREQRVENVLEVEAVEVSVWWWRWRRRRRRRLAKGGAELVKDLQHVEDDVELDHRLDPHVVVPLAHVEAQEQRRLGDDEQPAQDVAALVGCELAAARDAGEGGDDPQRQEGVQRDEGVEARAEAEEEQRLQIPRHLQEVVHAAPPPVVLQIVVGRAVVGLPAELLADEAAERERRRRRRGGRRRRRRRRRALALDPARRRHRRVAGGATPRGVFGDAFELGASSLNSLPEPRRELPGVEPQLAYALLIAPGVIAALAADRSAWPPRCGGAREAPALPREPRPASPRAAAGAATGMMSMDSSMRLSMLGVATRRTPKSADTISRE